MHCPKDMEFHSIPETFCVMSMYRARRDSSKRFQQTLTSSRFSHSIRNHKTYLKWWSCCWHISNFRKESSQNDQSRFDFFFRLLRCTFKWSPQCSRQSLRFDIQFLYASETTDYVSNQNLWQIFCHWIIELKLTTLQKKTIENFSRIVAECRQKDFRRFKTICNFNFNYFSSLWHSSIHSLKDSNRRFFVSSVEDSSFFGIPVSRRSQEAYRIHFCRKSMRWVKTTIRFRVIRRLILLDLYF